MNFELGKLPHPRACRDGKIDTMTQRKKPKRKKLTFNQRIRIWELAVAIGGAMLPLVLRLVLGP